MNNNKSLDNEDSFIPTPIPDDVVEAVEKLEAFINPVPVKPQIPNRSVINIDPYSSDDYDPMSDDLEELAEETGMVLGGVRDTIGRAASEVGNAAKDAAGKVWNNKKDILVSTLTEGPAGTVKATVRAVTGDEKVADAFTNLATKAEEGRSYVEGSTRAVDNKPPLDFIPPESSSSGYNFHPYRLDYNSKPIEVRLSTGIQPNCYSPLFNDGIPGTHWPLHITGAKLSLPIDETTQKLNTYINNVMTYIMMNKVQQAVSFSIPSSFTTDNIRQYLTAIMNALQKYYFYDSILQYCNNSSNRNAGLLQLRKVISADDINYVYELRRLLQGLPIPPNLLTMIYWLNQIYETAPLPGASIIKISSVPFDSGGTPQPDWLNTQFNPASVDGLNNSTNREIATILARALPNWLNQVLPGSSLVALHDPNFTTVWKNLPSTFANTTSAKYFRTPTVQYSTDTITYQTETNTLDGAAYALTSIWKSSTNDPTDATSKLIPSLIYPVASSIGTNITTNRLSWYNNLASIYVNKLPVLSRDETYWFYSNAVTATPTEYGSVVCIGNEPVSNVSADTVTQTAYQVVEWLLSLDTIKPRLDKLSQNTNKKRNKRKSK